MASTRFILAVLLLLPSITAENTTGIPRGRPVFIDELCTNETQVYRWFGQILYSPSDWTSSLKGKATYCPPSQGQDNITHVFCGIKPEQHWPHTADWVYNCWYHFSQFPNAKKVLLSSRPLGEPVLQKLRLLNISVVKSLPPPACTSDIVFHRKPNTVHGGWHHDEPGANFISVESARSFRKHLLRHLERLHLKPRFSRATHQGVRAPYQIQIGVLNRHGSRRLTNPEQVKEAFANHSLPVEIHTLDDMETLQTFDRQCLWANQMDIIISPHGAQLANLVCALPCTVVVETFPAHYFIPGFFDPFFAALGLETFGIYLGTNGYKETAACRTHTRCRMASRNRVVIQMPEIFKKLPPLLLSSWHKCCSVSNCSA